MASESIKRKYKNRHKCFKKMPKIRQLILDDDIWAITCKHRENTLSNPNGRTNIIIKASLIIPRYREKYLMMKR